MLVVHVLCMYSFIQRDTKKYDLCMEIVPDTKYYYYYFLFLSNALSVGVPAWSSWQYAKSEIVPLTTCKDRYCSSMKLIAGQSLYFCDEEISPFFNIIFFKQ